MKETKIYCDHCGKVLDEMCDYTDTEIEVRYFFKCDLCAECIDKLDKIVLAYCKKGGE
jgi:hypothetical protein